MLSRETVLGFSPGALPPSRCADLFPNTLRRNARIHFYQLIGESPTLRTKPATKWANLDMRRMAICVRRNNAMTQLSRRSPVCKETAELQRNILNLLMIHE